MASLFDSVRRAYNAFSTSDESESYAFNKSSGSFQSFGAASSYRPDRSTVRVTNERSIISSIYTRIAIDGAAVQLKHIRLDDQGRYSEDIRSGLNECLTVQANLDQAARAFKQDIVMTICDKGVAAIVPVDTSLNPLVSGSYDILTMRVGEVVNWYPKHVRVSLYNEAKGKREEITLPKEVVGIVENPLFAVMNEKNSTLQRLTRKLSLLDSVDEQSASGKLDLIIQLPYVIKSEARKQQAQQRRDDIEFQLKGSKYGIAYTDGTEKITQLNRPAENNLGVQVKELTEMLYGQLGITAAVMNGTADEKEMLNYQNRTIKPIIEAVVEEMKRKFITKTGRSQKQSIGYFTDPFALVPVEKMAEIADKLTRNEILSSNEIRQGMGIRPSSDPKADKLINSNMPIGDGVMGTTAAPDESVDDPADDPEKIMTEAFDSVDAQLDGVFKELGVNEEDI